MQHEPGVFEFFGDIKKKGEKVEKEEMTTNSKYGYWIQTQTCKKNWQYKKKSYFVVPFHEENDIGFFWKTTSHKVIFLPFCPGSYFL